MQYDYILVDCHLLAYRGWWKLRELSTPSGIPTGLEYGFIKNILALQRTYQPGKIVLAWDGRPVRCETIFPKTTDPETGEEVGYKSGRQKHEAKESEPPWTPRLDRLRNAYQPFVTSLYNPETEADEEIARFVYAAEEKGKDTLIISKDRDMHQLVSHRTHLVVNVDETSIMTPTEVREKWGLDPDRVVLRRAIEGDPGDGFKGIPRFPKDIMVKIASAAEPHSLSSLLKECIDGGHCKSDTQLTKLLKGRDIIERNFRLSELKTQSEHPPTFMEPATGDSSRVMEICKDLGFNSLFSRKEWQLFGEPAVL